MTEQEWLDCTDPKEMMEFLFGKTSDRKLRLLGAAFCRRTWRFLPAGACREAVGVAERYADGLANDRERQDVRKRAAHQPHSARLSVVNAVSAVFYLNDRTAGKRPSSVSSRGAIANAASQKYERNRKKSFPLYRAAFRAAERAEARLIRCVCGNPFRPVRLDPDLLARNGALATLAETVYAKRRLPGGTLDPRRLSELADALEEAGCRDQAMLSHLRGPGPHVRGCWPVDLLSART